MYKLNEFEELEATFINKRTKVIMEPIIRLIKKLEEREIVDEELAEKFGELLEGLKEFENADKKQRKAALYKNSEIIAYSRKQYELVAKGTLQNESMGLFMCIGLALGTAFSARNTALLGVGLPIGLAIGLAVGGEKEKKAEEKGLVY